MQTAKGSALVDYSIIIALVALVLTPVLISTGGIITDSLKSFSNIFASNNQVIAQNQAAQKEALANSLVNLNTATDPSSTTTTDPTGTTSGTTTSSSCGSNCTSINLGAYQLTGIPQNYQEFIETTGASGASTNLTQTISQLSARLDELLQQDPSNVDLQNMSAQAKILVEKGYLVADTQEWMEHAAMAVTDGNHVMPDDNLVCENGELYNNGTNPNCSGGMRDVHGLDYINDSNIKIALANSINRYTDEFWAVNQNFVAMSQNQKPEVKQIAAIVNQLSSEIKVLSADTISNADIIQQQIGADPTYYSVNTDNAYTTLKKQVASKATDLKTSLINVATSSI